MAELLSSASLYIADSPPQLSDAEKYPAMSEDIFREYQKLSEADCMTNNKSV